MKQSQKFNFLPKVYQYVASLPDRDFSDTVLLSSRGWDILLYESLVLIFFLKLIDFYVNLRRKSIKNSKKSIFSNFQFFAFFRPTDVRVFDLAISYKPKPDPPQIIKHTLLFPEIHSNWNLSVWSKVKNSIFYQNVTNMSPAFRIVIFLTPYYSRAENETLFSISYFEEIFDFSES